MNRIVGQGWATVELERAASELAGSLAPGTEFEGAARSILLGARCLRGRAGPPHDEDGPEWIVLLEPDTEGRLAGFLARSGEGWVATWSVADAATEVAGSGGVPGPLGDERLAEASEIGGPYRLLLSAATIDR